MNWNWRYIEAFSLLYFIKLVKQTLKNERKNFWKLPSKGTQVENIIMMFNMINVTSLSSLNFKGSFFFRICWMLIDWFCIESLGLFSLRIENNMFDFFATDYIVCQAKWLRDCRKLIEEFDILLRIIKYTRF